MANGNSTLPGTPHNKTNWMEAVRTFWPILLGTVALLGWMFTIIFTHIQIEGHPVMAERVNTSGRENTQDHKEIKDDMKELNKKLDQILLNQKLQNGG